MSGISPSERPTPVLGGDGNGWPGLVLGAALVAMSLVTGLIYTFSVAVMPNLSGADDRTFVATMQRFNENPAFSLSFTGALVLTALAAVLQRRSGPGVAVRWTIAALVLYAVVLAVTAGFHIPLNQELDQAGDPDRIAALAHVRTRFEGPWVAGNTVRLLFSTAAVAALARALLLHGRSTADRETAASAGGHPERRPPSPGLPVPHLRPSPQGVAMTKAAPPRASRRRVRDRQRVAHLVAGVLLGAYVYVGPVLGSGISAVVQWVVVPVVVGSGVALWTWPRIRSSLRGPSHGGSRG